MINALAPRTCPRDGCLKPASPIFIATFALCLLCFAPVRGDWYECYANDWYEAPIGEGPSISTLYDPNWPIYQNTTWFDTVRVWINSQTIASSLTLKVGDLEITDNNNTWEIAIESCQLHKTANGDWWAEEVCVYRNSNSIVLENVNLGQAPLTVGTAASGGSNLTLNAEIIEPLPQYKPPVVTLSAGGASTAGGAFQNIQAPNGSTLTFSMSATDANDNYARTRLWVRAGESGGWSEIYNSTASSGSCDYTLGPLAGHYYFKSRALDDTNAESVSAIIHVEAVSAPSGNNAAFVSQSVPATIIAGQAAQVSVTMQNTGSSTWSGTGQYPHGLGSQNPQDNATWGTGRISVGSAPVQPGETKTFNFTIMASSTGSYNFQWRMVQDGREWFGGLSPNINITVTDLTTPGEDGIPIGMADSNNNGIPDLFEAALGLSPSGTNNTIPANITRQYHYNEVNELTQSPERGYQLDAEGNIKGK